MVADPEVIRSERHGLIGQVLIDQSSEIIDRWSRLTLETYPESRRLHQEALRDHLPHLLCALGEELVSQDTSDAPHRRPAVEHGFTRWEDGWSLEELVQDFLLLRLVILEHLEQAIDRPLRSQEVMVLGLALDEAVTSSITTYVQRRDRFVREIEERRLEDLSQRERRKDEFLATLGHELRNPLAAITGALELTRLADPQESAFLDAQDILKRQVGHMTRLVDDLLDVARICRGKLELRKQRVELGTLLSHAVETVANLIQARGHALRVLPADQPIWLDADPARVQQIVTNLLVNAAKYTPVGGRIEVQLAASHSSATIRVVDNGIGIEPALLPRIFDLFSQFDLPAGSSSTGLGIGLTLVRHLTELHGGRVDAHSQGRGHGCEFVVELPTLPAGAEPPPRKLSSGTAASLPPVASKRVLVVEDHADLRNMLSSLVRKCGQHVEVAVDALSAIEKAHDFQPDVVLLDIGLPGMNGYELAEWFRSQPEFGGVLLVALTGYGQEEDRHRSQAAGFDLHLVKPVALDTLERILRMDPASEPN